MSRRKESNIKLSNQEIAEQILQMYTKSFQDHKSLKNILSETCVLDYFGKLFYGQDKVVSHLISNLYGSNYELSSLSINDRPSLPQFKAVNSSQDNLDVDDDLGVTLISPPKFTFPSVTFTTPVRSFSLSRKRNSFKMSEEASVEDCKTHMKKSKLENTAEQSSSSEKSDDVQKMLMSPEFVQTLFHQDMKYLTAYGTICYPKRVFSTVDLKRIKQNSLVALRGRFCQLYIGFECDSHVINVANCRIRTIKYSLSSKITPRNLLKAFDEVEMNS